MADDTVNSDLVAPNVDDNSSKSIGAGGDTNVAATEEASSPIAGEDSIEDGKSLFHYFINICCGERRLSHLSNYSYQDKWTCRARCAVWWR